jgi:hypothetical protein
VAADSGVEIQCASALDLVLLVDGTDTMGTNIDDVRSSLQRIVQVCEENSDAVRIAIILFSGDWILSDESQPTAKSSFTVVKDFNVLEGSPAISSVSSLQAMDGKTTVLKDAFEAAKELFISPSKEMAVSAFLVFANISCLLFVAASGQRDGAAKGVIMITDGPSQLKSGDDESGSIEIDWGELDVKVASVGFGGTYDELQVESVSSGDDYLAIFPDYNLGQQDADFLVKLLCPDSSSPTKKPTVYPTTAPTGKPSSFRPTSFPTHVDATVSPTRLPTFSPSAMPEHCANVMDVMIVLDSSNSIGAFNFDKLKSFAAE